MNTDDTFKKHIKLLKDSLLSRNLLEEIDFEKVKNVFVDGENDNVTKNDLESLIGKRFEELTSDELNFINRTAEENGWVLDGEKYKKYNIDKTSNIGRKWNGNFNKLFPKGKKIGQVEYWTFTYEVEKPTITRNVYIKDEMPDVTEIENKNEKNMTSVYKSQLIDIGDSSKLNNSYKEQMKNLSRILRPDEFKLFVKNPTSYKTTHEISPFPPTKAKVGREYFSVVGWDKIRRTSIFSMFKNIGEAVRYAIYLDKNENTLFGGMIIKTVKLK